MTVYRIFIVLMIGIFSSGSVLGQTCKGWKLSREQTEEGRQLLAHTCSPGDRGASILLISCSGKRFSLRYIPRTQGDFTNVRKYFLFKADDVSVGMPLSYEAMDGAFARSNLSPNHPVIGLFIVGRSLKIHDPAGKIATKPFALGGAGTAIQGLLKACN